MWLASMAKRYSTRFYLSKFNFFNEMGHSSSTYGARAERQWRSILQRFFFETEKLSRQSHFTTFYPLETIWIRRFIAFALFLSFYSLLMDVFSESFRHPKKCPFPVVISASKISLSLTACTHTHSHTPTHTHTLSLTLPTPSFAFAFLKPLTYQMLLLICCSMTEEILSRLSV